MTTATELERARNSLLSYYQQWQTITEAEGTAIHAGNWAQVERWQASKQPLQEFILAATGTLRAEAEAAGANPAEVEKEFHGLLQRLIHLESHNREAIAARRRQAQMDMAQLASSHHNLRQVQQAYAPPRSALWQSYS